VVVLFVFLFSEHHCSPHSIKHCIDILVRTAQKLILCEERKQYKLPQFILTSLVTSSAMKVCLTAISDEYYRESLMVINIIKNRNPRSFKL
jgi:hypothetical protein